MRWFIALMLALVMVTPAFAGEDPYVATVTYLGTAAPLSDTSANTWYISQKHRQFLLDEAGFLGSDAMCAPIPGTTQQCEKFKALPVVNQPEVCWFNSSAVYNPSNPPDPGFRNAKVGAGTAGTFEWWVRLPKIPSSEINLVLECGVLKPNAFTFWQYQSIERCAGETGERVGSGCTRNDVDPGTNPLVIAALPKITAIAYPGQYNVKFAPFNLTAFKNPGAYNPFGSDPLCPGCMVNNASAQLLDAVSFPNQTRIVLKACMDKTIITKLPITGQINALNQVEHDLFYGDLIYVRLDIPNKNTVDIYCNQQSLKVVGVGDTWF